MNLTKKLADALCTIIAIGFIDANQSTEKIKNIAFNSERSSKPKITSFQYEKPDDKDNYDALAAKLGNIKVKTEFKMATPKYVQPLIFAKTNTMFDSYTLEGIASDLHKLLEYTEVQFTKKKIFPLPGAYVGGLASSERIHISGPSLIYSYEPHYREDVDAGVGISHRAAKEISDAIIEILAGQHMKKISTMKASLVYEPERRRTNGVYTEGYLFASCHGMILAMYDFLDNSAGKICAEIAMGNDTNKVASCLPCSLFMTANESPASATHLGRGDNWNIPQGLEKNRKTVNWGKTVIDTYTHGWNLLKGKNKTELNDLNEYITTQGGKCFIPEIFLEALTYEGSFMDKINNSLR